MVGGRGGHSKRLERERDLEGAGTSVICRIPINEIIKLPFCSALKQACRRDANCTEAQSILAETPECEPEVAQTHSIFKGQNQIFTWRWGYRGASGPILSL